MSAQPDSHIPDATPCWAKLEWANEQIARLEDEVSRLDAVLHGVARYPLVRAQFERGRVVHGEPKRWVLTQRDQPVNAFLAEGEAIPSPEEFEVGYSLGVDVGYPPVGARQPRLRIEVADA